MPTSTTHNKYSQAGNLSCSSMTPHGVFRVHIITPYAPTSFNLSHREGCRFFAPRFHNKIPLSRGGYFQVPTAIKEAFRAVDTEPRGIILAPYGNLYNLNFQDHEILLLTALMCRVLLVIGSFNTFPAFSFPIPSQFNLSMKDASILVLEVLRIVISAYGRFWCVVRSTHFASWGNCIPGNPPFLIRVLSLSFILNARCDKIWASFLFNDYDLFYAPDMDR